MRKLISTTLVCLAMSSIAAPQPVAANEPEKKSLSINGFEMSYLEQGSGPLLILVHGNFSDMRTWQEVIPKLAKTFRVIAPTQRYFGKSEWDEAWPSFHRELLVDDLAALIRALDAGPANLAGWSLGSQVAHIASLRYPKLVRSAYLFEGTAPIQLEIAQTKADAALSGKYLGPLIAILKEKGPQSTIKPTINVIVGDPNAWDQLKPEVQEMHRDNARIFAFVGPKYMPKPISCDRIKSSRVPTRYVYGTESIEPFQRSLSRIRNCVGPSLVKEIKGATHGWPGQDTDGFVSSVSAFVRQHDD